MANAIKWATPSSATTMLDTELNSLGNALFHTTAGTVYNNATNKNQYAIFEIYLASLDPVAGAFVQLNIQVSLDGGTNYQTAPTVANNPSPHSVLCVCGVDETSSAKYIITPIVPIPPFHFRVWGLNRCGVQFAASGNTVEMYTFNDEVQ